MMHTFYNGMAKVFLPMEVRHADALDALGSHFVNQFIDQLSGMYKIRTISRIFTWAGLDCKAITLHNRRCSDNGTVGLRGYERVEEQNKTICVSQGG